jgi:hypothetical protein
LDVATLTLVNVWQDTTLGDCDVTEQLVQFLIVADGELKMTGDDTGLLVVASSVASQLEDFSGEVLKNGSQVHWGTGTDTLSVVALAEQTVDTTNRERETSLGRTAKVTVRDGTRKCDAIRLTIERSWSQRPCHQICRQSF